MWAWVESQQVLLVDTPTMRHRGILGQLDSVHFCRRMFPELRAVPSAHRTAGRIDPCADTLLPGISGDSFYNVARSANVGCSYDVSVSSEAAGRAYIPSVVGMMPLPALRASLARVGRINILNHDADESGLVLYELL